MPQRWFALLFAVAPALAACPSEDAPPDVAEGPADWFRCDPASPCDRFDDDGLRLNSDGTFQKIEAEGASFSPGDSYCVWPKVEGETYTLDGDTLTLARATGTEVHDLSAWRRTMPVGAPAECPADMPRDPVVELFEFDPKAVPPGGTSTLRWRVTDATAVEVFGPTVTGPAEFLGAEGEETIGPIATALRYRLEAHGNLENLSRFAEVEVVYDRDVVVETTTIEAIAIAGDDLFWSVRGTPDDVPRFSTGAIMRADLDGANERVIASMQVYAGPLDAESGVACHRALREWVEFPEEPVAVLACHSTDGAVAASSEIAARPPSEGRIVVAGGFVYTTIPTSTSASAIVRAPIDDPSALEVVAGGLHYTNFDFELREDRLYYRRTQRFSDAFLVMTLGSTSTTATITATPDEFGGNQITAGPTVDATHLYYAEAVRDFNTEHGRILRVPLAGGDAEVVVDDLPSPLEALEAVGAQIFWRTRNGAHLGQTDPATGVTRVIVAEDDPNSPIVDFEVTPTHVYWAVGPRLDGTGRIERTDR